MSSLDSLVARVGGPRRVWFTPVTAESREQKGERERGRFCSLATKWVHGETTTFRPPAPWSRRPGTSNVHLCPRSKKPRRDRPASRPHHIHTRASTEPPVAVKIDACARHPAAADVSRIDLTPLVPSTHSQPPSRVTTPMRTRTHTAN